MAQQTGVIVAQPDAHMPNYGRLNGFMSKGTMDRYRIEADTEAGTITWFSGDDPPKVFALGGEHGRSTPQNQGLPIVDVILLASFARPRGLRYESFVALIDRDGNCVARTFKLWQTHAVPAWKSAFGVAEKRMGLRFVNDSANLRKLNKRYHGCSRWWILQTPGWVLIPYLVIGIVLLAILFGVIELVDPNGSSGTALLPPLLGAVRAAAASLSGG